jgi:hypothetical protein
MNAKAKKKTMKNYLAIYLGTTAVMEKFLKLPPKVRREREAQGIQAWHAWADKNKKSIVHMGAPLGTTKRIDKKGITNTSNALGAFTIVQAESHAAAAKLFKDHPHFTIFPGESVEVMECMKIPGM